VAASKEDRGILIYCFMLSAQVGNTVLPIFGESGTILANLTRRRDPGGGGGGGGAPEAWSSNLEIETILIFA
jgi:hypothetical protein